MGTLGESRARSQIEKPLELPVVGREHAPNLIAWLEGQNVVIKAPPKDIDAAIASQDEDVVLRIGPEFPRAMAQEPAGAAGNHPGQHPPGRADPGARLQGLLVGLWRAGRLAAPARARRQSRHRDRDPGPAAPTWPRPRRNAAACCPSSCPTC